MTQPKLNTHYRQFTFKNDPRTMLQLPKDVMDDIKKMAEFNQRSLKEEIVARLTATLKHNDDMMQRDQLHQLIFNSNLAVENRLKTQKKNNHRKKK